MSETSMQALRDRLQKTTEQETEAARALIKTELTKLENDLINYVGHGLSSIKKNISSEIDKLNEEVNKLKKTREKVWIKPLVTGLNIFLGLLIGSWGLTQYLSGNVRDLLNDRRQISAQIQTDQNTLNGLETKTWGLKLLIEKGEKYVILPPGYIPEIGLTYGKGKDKRKAIKISRG